MNELDKSWLGGVVDSEGSIYISKIKERRVHRGYQYVARMTISNTHRGFLEHAKSIIGFGAIYLSKESRNTRWKDRLEFKLNPEAMRVVLPEIIPYLIIKQKVAEKMLEFLSLVAKQGDRGEKAEYSDKLQSVYAEIKVLNKKGK